MADNICSTPNNVIAIVFRKTDLKNNSYLLVPEKVSLGQIDEHGFFCPETNDDILPSASQSEFLKSNDYEYVYGYSVLIDELKQNYPDAEADSALMYCYFKDIAKNLTLAVVEDDIVNLFSKDYALFSEHIVGETSKYIGESNPQTSPKVTNTKRNFEDLKTIDNFALEAYVKERVFEADDIIEDICTTIAMNYSARDPKEIKSMLSIGPTGSGKTMTYQVIAEYLGVPLTIYDCNSLTSAGYVGKDIEDALREVYENAKQNRELAEKSILLFDEVDKLACRGNDVKDRTVQQAMLKMLEGFKYNFPLVKNGPDVTLDTSFMTIACSGAFPELFETVNKKLGFAVNNTQEESVVKLTDEDLVNYGMLRELVGRWKLMFTYKAQTKESLRRILLESRWSPLLITRERYQTQFNTELIWDESFIDAFIEDAFKRNVGGRSLAKINSNAFVKIDREVLRLNRENPKTLKKVVVTGDTIHNNRDFKI